MPRMKNEERDLLADQTRQRLLEAAALAFAQHGYDAANINAISLSAGYAKGTVYNYFASKHELIRALVSETAARHTAAIAGPVAAEGDPLRRLGAFFSSGFDFIAANLPRMRVMIQVIYGADRELQVHIFDAYQPLFTLMAQDVLAYGMAAGRFRPLDPPAMSQLLLTVYLGVASQVTDDGFFFIKADQLTDFARRALIAEGGI